MDSFIFQHLNKFPKFGFVEYCILLLYDSWRALESHLKSWKKYYISNMLPNKHSPY